MPQFNGLQQPLLQTPGFNFQPAPAIGGFDFQFAAPPQTNSFVAANGEVGFPFVFYPEYSDPGTYEQPEIPKKTRDAGVGKSKNKKKAGKALWCC